MSHGKVAIVTAASRGIGRGCTQKLAAYRADRIRMVSIASFFVADSMTELFGWDVPEFMLGRPVRYGKFAKVVAFLLSDNAQVITGTTL